MRHGEKQQLNERQFDGQDLLSCTKLIKINLSVETYPLINLYPDKLIIKLLL